MLIFLRMLQALQSVIDDAFGHQLCVIDDAQLMNVPVHVFV